MLNQFLWKFKRKKNSKNKKKQIHIHKSNHSLLLYSSWKQRWDELFFLSDVPVYIDLDTLKILFNFSLLGLLVPNTFLISFKWEEKKISCTQLFTTQKYISTILFLIAIIKKNILFDLHTHIQTHTQIQYEEHTYLK